MNPIVHAELGWLLSQRLRERRDRILVTIAGVIPDLDGLSLLGGEEAYGRWHHLLTHGAIAAAVAGALGLALGRERVKTALLVLAAFHLHILCDLAGSGPGWPILYWYPFSSAEWFWSGQWNLASWQNSVIGMAATLACLAGALIWGRTVVEIFSLRADAAVVSALRKRFGKTAQAP